MPDAVMLPSRHPGSDPGDDPTQPLESPHHRGLTPWVRRAIKQSLFTVGYYHQRLSASSFPGVAVLCYHGVRISDDPIPFSDLHVTKATFERHCRLISNTCNPISLSELLEARRNGSELPPRSVIVTFDDGYRGVLDNALPILERYGIPAAVFVSAAPVLDGRHFWFDALCRRQGEAAVLNARALPYGEWRALTDATATALDETESHRPLTPAELKRLAASPLIEIGAHTMTHPTLALAPVEDQQHEIASCRAALESVLGGPVTAFAYPYGNVCEDYTSDTVSLVRDARFDLAFTTGASFATLECDPLQIPRFMMLDAVGAVELAHRLLHSWRSA
jgi:peptidoglycan/xylan/chitin deacetylase (PgdA/CDA1 family)